MLESEGPDDIVRFVLGRALWTVQTAEESRRDALGADPAPHFGRQWVAALGYAFREVYNRPNVTVFAHEVEWNGPGKKWRRSEYLFDLSVVEFDSREAPFHPGRAIPFVRRCLWQVESEIALNATSVAEDLGKLAMGRSCWSLMVVARPEEERFPRWKDAIESFAAPIRDGLYVAFIPSYAGQGRSGWVGGACVMRKSDGRLEPVGGPVLAEEPPCLTGSVRPPIP